MEWRTLSKPLKKVQQMSKADLLALLGTGKRLKPVDVSDVGAAVSSSSYRKLGGASVSATVVAHPPEVRFQQGDKEHCVA